MLILNSLNKVTLGFQAVICCQQNIALILLGLRAEDQISIRKRRLRQNGFWIVQIPGSLVDDHRPPSEAL